MITVWTGRAADLALCGGFALLVWIPLGRSLLTKTDLGMLAGSAAASMAIGMALWGLAILVLGLSSLLNSYLLIAIILVLFVYLRLHRFLPSLGWGNLAPHRGAREILQLVPIAALALYYFALVFGSSLAPELSFDALNVHLPYARDSAASRRLLFEPNNWSSMMPALPLMAYVTGFLFSGVTLAKLFNALCYLACGGVTFLFARTWWGPLQGMAAALLVWSCPVLLYEGTTAMIDIPLTLYSGLAVFSLLHWTLTAEEKYLWFSAASLGLALGCKYQAAFWALPFTLVVFWHARRARGFSFGVSLQHLLRYGLIAALLFSPWMIRAWYLTGNPVFPLANRVFHSPFFPPAMERAALAAYANEGVGRSLPALLALPWTLTFSPGPFRGTPGVIFLVGIALSFFRNRGRQIRYGFFLLAGFFYTWALTAQEIRYLMPAVPLMAILATRGLLGGAADREKDVRSGFTARVVHCAGYLALLAGASLAIPAVYPAWVGEWTYWHSYKSPLRYLSGRETAQDFLARDVPSIYAYDYINAHLAPNDRVLLLNDAFQFYSRVPTLYSFTVEGERILSPATEREVMARLADSRITHVLINYNGLAPLPGVEPREGVYFFLDAAFQGRHLLPVFSKNKVTLFKVRGT